MSKSKRIIIWTKGLDNFLEGSEKFNGGIAVQMTFWAKTFLNNNWHVYSISEKQNATIEGIHFIKSTTFKKIGIITELFSSLLLIFKVKPNVIIRRGASRNLFFTAFWAKLFGLKLILMGAHDTDFEIGNEIIHCKHDKHLYKMGVNLVKYFIVQNTMQENRLQENYEKKSILRIPNIWLNKLNGNKAELPVEQYILWVANFHKRKRPEWFIELAKMYPEKKFVMVGGPGDKDLFIHCSSSAEHAKNLLFLGPQNFSYTNLLFAKAILFICTSESEGFPNTFLQAWSNNIPVITTFDPSDVVKKKKLGIVVNNIVELNNATKQLINEPELYKHTQVNIQAYFNETHNNQKAYEKIIDRFNI